MSLKRKADPQKIQAARESLLECLSGVEAAVGDLRTHGLCIELLSVVESPAFLQQLQNRILLVALSLQRIEGAARRLLKRLGEGTGQFEKALRSSVPIQLTNRLANSWKHGLGGQQNNATLLNGVFYVRRGDGFKDASGEERVHVLGMLVTDAIAGVSPSGTLFSLASRAWGAILQEFVPESPSWAARLFPEPEGLRIEFPHGVKPVVPVGATLVFPLPDKLRVDFTAEAKRRGASA